MTSTENPTGIFQAGSAAAIGMKETAGVQRANPAREEKHRGKKNEQ